MSTEEIHSYYLAWAETDDPYDCVDPNYDGPTTAVDHLIADDFRGFGHDVEVLVRTKLHVSRTALVERLRHLADAIEDGFGFCWPDSAARRERAELINQQSHHCDRDGST